MAKPPDPRSRALDLAIPVASCGADARSAVHLTAGLSRDELLALVGILAAAADPAAVRELVRDPSARVRRDPGRRAALLRAAHAQAEACRKASRPVPPHLAALEREYWRDRKRAQLDAAAREAQRQMALIPAREPEPCPSLPAYRRHKARGEDTEACGCGEAARAAWRERKRDAARRAGPRPEAGQEQRRGEAAA